MDDKERIAMVQGACESILHDNKVLTTQLAAAEQRAASMAARIAGFDPCAIDLENTSFIVCFFCGANLDCDAETPRRSSHDYP